MAIELKMPALSPTMEEGKLAKWLVKEGDAVQSGDILAEIETDKATMEFEAVDEGTIAQILVPEGTDEVKVGAVIAIMAAEGEDVSAPAPAPAEPAPKAEPAAPPQPESATPAKAETGTAQLAAASAKADVAGGHRVAFLDQPAGERPLLHRGRERGHLDLDRHQ